MARYKDVCAIRSGRLTVEADKSDGYRNLFPRLAYCARCGGSLMTHWQSGRDYGYYVCRTRRRGGGCSDGPTHRLDFLDEMIVDGLEWSIGISDKVTERIASGDEDREIEVLRSKLTELQEQAETISLRMAIADMPEVAVADLGRRYAAKIADITAVEREVQEAETKLEGLKRAIRQREQALQQAVDLRELINSTDGRRRLRHAIRSIVSRIEVDTATITLDLKVGISIKGIIIPSATVERVGSGKFRPVKGACSTSWTLIDD
jgi:hypothetical protein